MRRLTNSQISLLAQYFSDLSKILFGASVVGYLFPTSTFPVTLTALFVGSLTAAACLLYAMRLSAELTTASWTSGRICAKTYGLSK